MATYAGTNDGDSFTGTTGADTFNFTTLVGGADTIDGGTGIDTLNLDYSSFTQSYYGSLISSDTSGFAGTIYG